MNILALALFAGAASAAVIPREACPIGSVSLEVAHAQSAAARVPIGFTLAFQGLEGSVQKPEAYLGYRALYTYDAPACASYCAVFDGCKAFNIHANVISGCDQVDFHCALYSAPVSTEVAVNHGVPEIGIVKLSNGYNAIDPAAIPATVTETVTETVTVTETETVTATPSTTAVISSIVQETTITELVPVSTITAAPTPSPSNYLMDQDGNTVFLPPSTPTTETPPASTYLVDQDGNTISLPPVTTEAPENVIIDVPTTPAAPTPTGSTYLVDQNGIAFWIPLFAPAAETATATEAENVIIVEPTEKATSSTFLAAHRKQGATATATATATAVAAPATATTVAAPSAALSAEEAAEQAYKDALEYVNKAVEWAQKAEKRVELAKASVALNPTDEDTEAELEFAEVSQEGADYEVQWAANQAEELKQKWKALEAAEERSA
ncbi:hypothetical protein BU23DRAFT_602386 [Bimuria novae-zelandiae CBS 107.79]|uniref:Apple domain-containing protein n=1 Tax=Bimuria novae-zelandiae CBS 107.79 TaxID=1447943 RepID=A0A6A5V4H2_9PLEO|nr:hypothetical protein BU23DRAFT_602386 [Bimuria novae-zelandiae CBS 107.79]